jgi:TRAP-type uncharacterized transport system fused permease subunit
MIGVAAEGYLYGKLNYVMRAAAFAGSLLLITENVLQDLIGFAVLAALLIYQRARNKDLKSV